LWEWLYIAATLDDAGLLGTGRTGVGFGVGTEPLAALFAARGCRILATDQAAAQAAADGWSTDEYAGGLAGLAHPELCPPEVFARQVTYRDVDMTALPADLGEFDFTWSSCAFEHLGSLAAGMEFVTSQMAVLRPGGLAVHTTECNLSSDQDTVAAGPTVLYRRRDLRDLAERLRGQGYRIDLDLTEGTTPDDAHVDLPPFSEVHLRTELGGFVTTSVALVIEKPA
jgi:hypothetical protein